MCGQNPHENTKTSNQVENNKLHIGVGNSIFDPKRYNSDVIAEVLFSIKHFEK